MSVFAKYRPVAYPYRYLATIHVGRIAGGIPTDPNVAEGWLRTKLGMQRDDLIRDAVAEVMVERGVTAEEATAQVNANRHLNGFKREPDSTLYIEGRQVKAAIKEAANVRWPKERWGPSRKGTLSFFAEHVFVENDHISLGVTEPSGVAQRFVHTWRGSAIQYEEYVDDVDLVFSVITDFEFKVEQLALLWLTAEQQGVGASRSQGYGRYDVTGWQRVDHEPNNSKQKGRTAKP
jgi:hypothetical protein